MNDIANDWWTLLHFTVTQVYMIVWYHAIISMNAHLKCIQMLSRHRKNTLVGECVGKSHSLAIIKSLCGIPNRSSFHSAFHLIGANNNHSFCHTNPFCRLSKLLFGFFQITFGVLTFHFVFHVFWITVGVMWLDLARYWDPLRVEFWLKTDGGYPKDAGVTTNSARLTWPGHRTSLINSSRLLIHCKHHFKFLNVEGWQCAKMPFDNWVCLFFLYHEKIYLQGCEDA